MSEELKSPASPEEQDRIKRIVVSSAIIEVIQQHRPEIIRIAASKLKQLGIKLSQEDINEITGTGGTDGSGTGQGKA